MAKHYHVLFHSVQGLVYADAEYKDATKAMQDYMDISRNVFHNQLKDSDSSTLLVEQEIYNMVNDDDQDTSHGMSVGIHPLHLLWMECEDGTCGRLLASRN